VVKARGSVDGKTTVSGRLVMERYNIPDSRPGHELANEQVRREMRELFALLWRPEVASALKV
jgi:hypothetical protein